MRGYKEEGTTTTPFDMVVLNEMDRFHLVQDVIDRLPQLAARAAYAKQAIRRALLDHQTYIAEHGEDHPWWSDGNGANRVRTPPGAVQPKPTTFEMNKPDQTFGEAATAGLGSVQALQLRPGAFAPVNTTLCTSGT